MIYFLLWGKVEKTKTLIFINCLVPYKLLLIKTKVKWLLGKNKCAIIKKLNLLK